MKLEPLVARDQESATEARENARAKLKSFNYPVKLIVDFTEGVNKYRLQQVKFQQDSHRDLAVVCGYPFHAMVEVEVQLHAFKQPKTFIWYVNEGITVNMPVESPRILAWTHPGVQIALTSDLDEFQDISAKGLALKGVRPLRRAKFTKLFPAIEGLYEPGGRVGAEEIKEREVGLKAVKLDMTKEQVAAFISQMRGIMIITGAPGSGKTTVAFQRIRFLLDQQENRQPEKDLIEFSVDSTRVFLANPNLIAYSKKLLEDELQISSSTVEEVTDFIDRYLNATWKIKHGARPLQRRLPYLEHRAREAFFSLCSAQDLRDCWKVYEEQIAERLSNATEAPWYGLAIEQGAKGFANELLAGLKRSVARVRTKRSTTNPHNSPARMGAIFRDFAGPYEDLRVKLSKEKQVEDFDGFFTRWLFHVYDPIDCLYSYFSSKTYQAQIRVRNGTASRVDSELVVKSTIEDLYNKRYGPELNGWVAWLLRFALPDEESPGDRFRGIPSALSPVTVGDWGPWNHIVIDEAQDLSVTEASLLCSLVHPKGALTVSADFYQTVSPVHGMDNPDAIRVGCPIYTRADDLKYTFSRNMRQTREITKFLQAFYKKNFKELPPFHPNDQLRDAKPELHLVSSAELAARIKQRFRILQQKRPTWSVALVQINEDEDRMQIVRSSLEKQAVPMGDIWEVNGHSGILLTTSAERIKGLEFDVCFVIGLDDAENSTLKHTVNRCYVALSRPARRLSILCEEFPSLLKGIDNSLYDIIDAT